MSNHADAARSIVAEVHAGRLRARDLAEAAVARAAELGERLGVFITHVADDVRRRADLVDARLRSGERPPLAGLMVAVKDNICVQGLPTTCGSRMLRTYLPPVDATAVTRLEAAGAVVLGKTNLDEFGMGSSTENSAFFPTRNPWAPDRTPGGSSGGSAVAVATGIAHAALGSDTGGSIRQPAAHCGVVGLKPTFGRVSRSGLVAFASSLDQIGPLARRVGDAALLFQAIAGADDADATCSRLPVEDCLATLTHGVQGQRVGIPMEAMTHAVDGRIRELILACARSLESAGASIVDVSLPNSDAAIAAYYILATAEASSNLARFDGIRFGHRSDHATDVESLMRNSRGEGLGPEVRRRILLGTWCLSAGYHDAYYGAAQRARALVRGDFEAAFAACDLILMPTTPTPAFRLGERTSDPVTMYASDVLTVACNLAGLPGLAVPCGFVREMDADLPVGAQLVGPAFAEAALFRAGQVIEDALGLAGRMPGVTEPRS